jgi:hypothetical protein
MCSLSLNPDQSGGLPSLLLNGYPEALSLGIKLPGHEVDHLPPYSGEMRNAWSYTYAPSFIFMA